MKKIDMKTVDFTKSLDESKSISAWMGGLSNEDIKKRAEETAEYVTKNYPISYKKLGE